MRQIDEIHHAEHEREPCGDEKQDKSELKTVEGLDEEQCRCHWRFIECGKRTNRCRSAGKIIAGGHQASKWSRAAP